MPTSPRPPPGGSCRQHHGSLVSEGPTPVRARCRPLRSRWVPTHRPGVISWPRRSGRWGLGSGQPENRRPAGPGPGAEADRPTGRWEVRLPTVTMAEGEPVGQCATCRVEPGSEPGIGRRVQAHTGLLPSGKARARAKAEAAPCRAETWQGPWRSPLANVHVAVLPPRATEAGLRQGPRPCTLATAASGVHPGFCLERSGPSLRPLWPNCVHRGCRQGLPGLCALNSASAPSLHSPSDSPGQRGHMKPCPFKSAPNRTKMASGRVTPHPAWVPQGQSRPRPTLPAHTQEPPFLPPARTSVARAGGLKPAAHPTTRP